MNKILSGAIAIIILILAVEGGYLWGIKRSTSSTPTGINISRQPALSPTPYPTQFPVSAIPDLLSYKTAVAVSQNATNYGVFYSDWSIGQAGVLKSLTGDSVTINFNGQEKTFNFPSGLQVIYSRWSNIQKAVSPSSSSEINPGDNVSINFTIETTNGNFKRLELVKNVD